MTTNGNGPEGFADEEKAVEDFLQFLPKRMQQYSKDCVVYNNATGRYEDPVSSNDTTNSGTTSPLEGRRAPPPTPAHVATALHNSNAALEVVPEQDSIALAVPSRAASPEPWPAIDAAEATPSGAADTADSTLVPTPTVAPESSATQGWDVVPGGKLTDSKEADVSKITEDAKAGEVSAAVTTKCRKIDPTTATIINAFAFLSANDGNKGLESSKFAKPSVFSRTSNSSRNRFSPLAALDPNTDNSRSDLTFQDKVVQAFRRDFEDDEMKEVRFALESTDGKPPVEVPPTTSPKLGDGGYSGPSKTTTARPATLAASTSASATQNATISSAATKIESTTEITTAADGENRQHATYFASWGAPETRTGPQAEVRSVIVKGLPVAIENTHVASMIHGGLLESYHLVKNPTSTFATAVVTFASAAPAKAFYDKYPNGLEMKLMGKKTIALVAMGDCVDVVSGVLRGYLESGATRVVRAEGADEDWAMRALRKIAEEKGRKLEAILDTSQDEGRTIEFRFTNISDAVAFRGSLIRSADWEDCNVQFGEDPCARKV